MTPQILDRLCYIALGLIGLMVLVDSGVLAFDLIVG